MIHIFQGLETIPHLKDDISDRDKRIAHLEKDMDEKGALLSASRKAVRDYIDRIRVSQTLFRSKILKPIRSGASRPLGHRGPNFP